MAACQDGYPIAPTLCDRYCDLESKRGCQGYNPAECVVSCEAASLSRACPDEFDEWVSCQKTHSSGLGCIDAAGTTPGCEMEQQALGSCVALLPVRDRGGPE